MSIKTLAAIAALAVSAPLAAQTPIRPGQTVTGTLQAGDPRMEGAYYVAYVLRGTPGEQVDHYSIRGRPGGLATVIAESRDFDPYLEFGQLLDGEVDVLDTDDDSGLGTTPLLLLRFHDDAEYRLVVSSFDTTGGRYTLRVLEGHVGGCDGVTPFQEKDDTVAVDDSSCAGLAPVPVAPGDIVRTGEGAAGLAMTPRLVATLARDRDFALPHAADWRGTRIPLPDGLAGRYRTTLTGQELRPGKHGLDASKVFSDSPVALPERME